MREHIEMELLNDAFNIFRDASSKLEQQYALLERKIEDLNEELAEKNRAMERNRRLSGSVGRSDALEARMRSFGLSGVSARRWRRSRRRYATSVPAVPR